MELTTTNDTEDLERLETVIQKNGGAFYDVGRALAEIRDRGLYKIKKGGEYKTFEEYCKVVWDFNSSRARQLITATEATDNVKNVTMVTPENERQARPLTRLKPPQQLVAWQKALDTAPDGKVTGAIISKIVKEMTIKPPDPPVEASKIHPTQANSYATTAIDQLSKIRINDPRRKMQFKRVLDWINEHMEDKLP